MRSAWAVLTAAIFAAGCLRGDVLTSRRVEVAADAGLPDASVGQMGAVRVSIEPQVATLLPGASRSFAARLVGDAEARVSWSASGGTVTATGAAATYLAPMTEGEYTLTVASELDPTQVATARITVTRSALLGMSIPSGHPRLWWNAQRMAEARTWLAANPPTPGARSPLERATQGLLANDAAECRAAIAAVLAIDTTSAPSSAAFDSGEAASLVFDWCYPEWTPSERDTFVQRWNTVFTSLLNQAWGGVTMPQNDTFWAWFGNEFEWGVATFGENPSAELLLRHALETRWESAFVPHALVGGLGAGLQEGVGAGGLVLERATVPLVSATLLGRDLWSETAFFHSEVFALAAATTPAPTLRGTQTPGFELFPSNDDALFQLGGSAQRRGYGDFVSAAASRWRGAPAGGVAQAWLELVQPTLPRHVAAVATQGPPTSFATLPLDTFLTGGGWAFARSGWGPRATVLHVQAGIVSGTGHDHRDVGNWQLWRDGAWLSRESVGYFTRYVGYANSGDEDASMSVAHNIVLVNGRGYAHTGGPNPPRLLRVDTRPEVFSLAVDVSPLYRLPPPGNMSVDNPAASHVEREFVFLRAQQLLLIFDRVETAAVGAQAATDIVRTFLAHFEAAPTIEDARHVTANNGTQALRLTSLVPTTVSYRVVDEGGEGQYRLEVDASGEAQGYFLHVLQARGAAEPNLEPSLVDEASAFVVTIGAASVRFPKGRSSSGTSVTVDGVTSALPDRVQPISYGEAGPVWGP